MADGTEMPAPAPAIDEATPADAPARNDGLDALDEVLRSFAPATNGGKAAEKPAPADAADQPPDRSAPSVITQAEIDYFGNARAAELLRAQAAEIHDNRSFRTNVSTFLRHQELEKRSAAVLSEAKKINASARFLPDDHAERWLLTEYHMNADLKSAWDNQFTDPKASRLEVDRALKRYRAAVTAHERSIPDPDVTADREAVAWAMHGASRQPPPAKPVNYTKMSDAEFRESVQKEHGFPPI